MQVTIEIGPYIVTPHQDGFGVAYIDVQRRDTIDEHDHPVGPSKTIKLYDLFKDEPAWK